MNGNQKCMGNIPWRLFAKTKKFSPQKVIKMAKQIPHQEKKIGKQNYQTLSGILFFSEL